MFQLPTDFISNINSNATAVLSALGPYIELILGVLLGVLVLGYLISAVSHHKS